MKEIRTEDAVGHVLCHDITQIIKDEKKGVLFKKGHIVREEDIPALLSVGKEHLYVWEKQEGILHENEAAEILYRISADIHMHGSDIKEGKIELIADCDGVLKIRRDALLAVNSLGEMMIASRHGDFPVKKGDKIAGTRIIPLVIEKSKMDKAEKVAGTKPIFSILPYRSKKVGIITTGSEVQKGLMRAGQTAQKNQGVLQHAGVQFIVDILPHALVPHQSGLSQNGQMPGHRRAGD